MRHITRRDVLRGAVGLTAGVCASRLLPWQLAIAETVSSPTVVVAEGGDDDTPEVLLRTALAPLGGIERFVKPGQTVVIKPNATWMNAPHTASSSDPDLLRAMINLVKAAGAARVIVVDRSVFDPPAALLEVSGLGPVLVETGAENMVLDRWEEPKSKYTMIEIPKGLAFQEIGVVKAAAEADVRINMAVAKTHIVLPVTLCCKHMMGFLENPPGLHTSLDQGIADIVGAPAIKADLHILEAIRVRVRGAAYGDGTDITDPDRVKRKNQVIAGTDPVLIDAYAAGAYFGRSPMEIMHIKRCFEAGLGEIDVNKALEAGQLRRFRPAEVLITPTPTAAPTATASAASEGTPAPRPTAQAAAAPAPTVAAAAPTPLPKSRTLGDSIMDLNPIVNAPLVPLAMVIGGVGMVVGRRLARQLPREGEASAADKPPVEPGNDR
ncbi:MAG: DUF362 domain-containing protein [Anaerolineae bacterium]